MALADFADLRAKVLTPAQINWIFRVATNPSSNNRYNSVWNASEVSSTPRGTPSTAAACDNTLQQAIPKSDGGSGRQIIVGGQYTTPNDAATGAVVGWAPAKPYMIIDRLSHQGGLVGNVTTLQTTNLPTAALTRYTSGVGVMAMIEVYTAWGASAPTGITVLYTNSAGTGSRTSLSNPPSLELNSVGCTQFLPLQAGDLGVKSVESLQLTGSTSAAGNAGITLFKVLGFGFTDPDGSINILNNAMWNEEVLDGACLQVLIKGQSVTTFPQCAYSLQLAEC